MSSSENVAVTWERSVEYGLTHYRSRDTASSWELAFDGDGWCLSRDGALLEWCGDPDGAMAWVAEKEARLRGPNQAGGEGEVAGPRSEDDVKQRFLVTLEREVTAWQHQEVEVIVEAADEPEAERKAILIAEEDDFDGLWEVMDCEEPYEILVPPSAGSVEAISGREDDTR